MGNTLLQYKNIEIKPPKQVEPNAQKAIYDFLFNDVSTRSISATLGISHQQVINLVPHVIRIWVLNGAIIRADIEKLLSGLDQSNKGASNG